MSLLHHIKKFRLVISNEEFYNRQIYSGGPFLGLWEDQGFLKPKKPLDLEYLTNEKILQGDWESFKDWYMHNNQHLLYRGLEGYTMSGLKLLLKYGNDRHAFDPKHNHDKNVYEQYGLRPQDFIWATPHSLGAWNEARSGNPKNMLITVYDNRLMKEIRSGAIYTLREGVNSFHDALLAAVLIYLRF